MVQMEEEVPTTQGQMTCESHSAEDDFDHATPSDFLKENGTEDNFGKEAAYAASIRDANEFDNECDGHFEINMKGPLLREAKRMVKELNTAIEKITTIRNRLSLLHTLGDRNTEAYLKASSQAKNMLDKLRSINLLEANNK